MKVGTDGVTLGAWAPCRGRVLDVGCGCGLIGLMAAQRGAREVVMIDIDPASAAEATANAAASPWADRVRTECVDFLEFEADAPFDCIISNPPFFASGLLAPDERRAAARHEGGLTPAAFMRKAAALAPCVSVILPPDRVGEWTFAAGLAGLRPERVCGLLTKPQAPPRRVMIAFSSSVAAGVTEESRLLIGSPDYISLTSPFYL